VQDSNTRIARASACGACWRSAHLFKSGFSIADRDLRSHLGRDLLQSDERGSFAHAEDIATAPEPHRSRAGVAVRTTGATHRTRARLFSWNFQGCPVTRRSPLRQSNTHRTIAVIAKLSDIAAAAEASVIPADPQHEPGRQRLGLKLVYSAAGLDEHMASQHLRLRRRHHAGPALHQAPRAIHTRVRVRRRRLVYAVRSILASFESARLMPARS